MADFQKLEIQELPPFLTVEEAGKVLRIGRNTAYSLVRCGTLRSLRVGRKIRVPRQALLELQET